MPEASEALSSADVQDNEGAAEALAYLMGKQQAESAPDASQKQQAEEAKASETTEAEAPEKPQEGDESGKPEAKEDSEYGWVTDDAIRADLAAANLKPEILAHLKGLAESAAEAEKNYARGFHRRMRELSDKEKQAKAVLDKATNFDKLMEDAKLQAAFKKALELAESDDVGEAAFDEDLASPEEREAHRRRIAREEAKSLIEAEKKAMEPAQKAQAIHADLTEYFAELGETHKITEDEFNAACTGAAEKIKALTGRDPAEILTPENARGWVADEIEKILLARQVKATVEQQAKSKANTARAIRATTPPPAGIPSGKPVPVWKAEGKAPTAEQKHMETLELLKASGIDLASLD